MEVKFPDVTVQLVGTDGNAFAVLGKVSRALRDAGHADEVPEFMAQATANGVRPAPANLHALGRRRVGHRPGR